MRYLQLRKVNMQALLKRITTYHIAIFLSLVSVTLGLLRELLIVNFLGFTPENDRLQLYLSIFYTIGLSIDTMRLSCLNLYTTLPLSRILFSATLMSLPFSIFIGLLMNQAAGGLDMTLLWISIIGSYLNLIAALLITYLQRNHLFLIAQIINVMPNIILIPGIFIAHSYLPTQLVFSIICLTSFIPIAQCLLLLLLAYRHTHPITTPSVSFLASITTFMRHFATVAGEQGFQMITRTAFYHYGTGYLSIYAIAVRLYSAVRFILIDSFIGSRLTAWKNESPIKNNQLLHSSFLGIGIATIALIISLKPSFNFIYAGIQMTLIFTFGFYFSTLVRIIYFHLNRNENNASLIMQFAFYECLFAFCAYLLTKQTHYPILGILWLGYIAKPFAQLWLLRRQY